MGLAVGRQSLGCVTSFPVSLPAPHVIYPSKPSTGPPPTKRPFWSHGTLLDQSLQVSSCAIVACVLGTWDIIDVKNQDAGSQERDLIWGVGKMVRSASSLPHPRRHFRAILYLVFQRVSTGLTPSCPRIPLPHPSRGFLAPLPEKLVAPKSLSQGLLLGQAKCPS